MDQNNILQGMLNLMVCPAFCVKDGMIVCLNQAAQGQIPDIGTPVSQILTTGTLEYSEFTQGCLYLTVNIGGLPWGASVARMEGFDVFVLEQESEQAELQAMALAAQELRQPLNNIMAVADLLFPYSVAEDAAAQDQVSKINKGLYQLLRIVSNMSDAYRYSQDPPGKEETIDLCDYLGELFQTTAEVVAHADVTLSYTGPKEQILSLANPERLERAVSNMLSNALKFAPKGGRIDAKLIRRGNMLYLTIQDNGDGIPASLRGSIFSRYQRMPGIEDSRHGIGLGMVLIRRTAAQHGGTVLIEHPEDCGTRITMTLAIRQNTEAIVSSPTFRPDYAGGRDRRLLEYADSLPAKLYDAKHVN